MQFQTPQFIDVEDKIFGPLTFKQFIYLAGAGGCSYLLWRLLPFIISLPLIGSILALAGGLAFMQYNGRPFEVALEKGFFFFLHPKLYLWNNERKRKTKRPLVAAGPNDAAQVFIPKLSDSKLHELAWSLDIKERIAEGVADEEERAQGGGVIQPITTSRDALVK